MFRHRTDAGQQLAHRLENLRGEQVIVLALPRGGVPVAREVALHLQAPLDLLLVRKLGLPRQPEVAVGAIGEEDVRVLNDELIEEAGLSAARLADVESTEQAELTRRLRLYRATSNPVSLRDRSVVIVDDGIATGATARAGCLIARARGASHIVMAVPVAPQGWSRAFEGLADDCIALRCPQTFRSVGAEYLDFDQTTDREVLDILHDCGRPQVDDQSPCNQHRTDATIEP